MNLNVDKIIGILERAQDRGIEMGEKKVKEAEHNYRRNPSEENYSKMNELNSSLNHAYQMRDEYYTRKYNSSK